MASSFGGIIGIVLFIIACKNFNKTYKEKSVGFKVMWCFGLFIAGTILAVLFLFLLNPDLSSSSLGENSVTFCGFFANIIALTLFFFKTKKHHKKGSKEYKSARNELILYILIPIIIFGFLFGYDIIKSARCKYPNMIIGNQCCMPNTDYGMVICQEEAQKISDQLKNAMDNKILTTEHEETIMDNFTILIPEKYYLVRNIKAGIFDIPLFLVTYGEEGEAMIMKVMYFDSPNNEGTIQSFYYEFMMGVEKTAPNNTQYSEPVFLQNSKNNFEYAIVNMTMNVNGVMNYGSQAIIKAENEILIISYASDSKEYFESYYYEFENMINSVDRIK